MASVNKVILVGNLGRDPEVRYMPNGDAVANFSIATTETWKDKNGMRQEKTEWHNIAMYRRLAEIAGEYLKKGSSVYIEGRLQTRKWSDPQGVERYTTEIVASEMQLLDGRGASAPQHGADESYGGGYGQGGGYPESAGPAAAPAGNYGTAPAPAYGGQPQQAPARGPAPSYPPRQAPNRPAPTTQPPPPAPPAMDSFDDDIPF